jgi:hypothetical protein
VNLGGAILRFQRRRSAGSISPQPVPFMPAFTYRLPGDPRDGSCRFAAVLRACGGQRSANAQPTRIFASDTIVSDDRIHAGVRSVMHSA